ncbi:A/G-specific adenine glycosylase [Leuconostoc lactis]|uniref:A/G-specific adenine glycosylase n=1 Tax=Leuconostoc lactis TaxID=1246 RepID=UPI000814EBD1|nr:A/G-specific adenine glycosylase [Leuconostoc lactis]ANY11472.1 A/G-specific adenine glycosylase [Leuconostoc lactis]MSB67065.1 A/G-specific adenine glycosylase [Leuconostoc lactis]RYS86531.1 A/G-specific adenine glycosylase [Leuconostoc lactis]
MEFWSEKTIENFRRTLLDWYDREGRATLPWRVDHDPYRVMVSEIMLQQTQVDTVLPYYERFMQALPTVQDLARAPEAQVLKLWEGLGYYSRARNLQKAARFVVDDLHGHWPESADDLQVLPGVGPYTSAAIASISFGEVVPAVDGNAYRVFSRLLKIDADIAQPKSRKIFYDAILPIVDPDRPGDFNQAIMDLGSSYMTAKNPNSADSPVRAFNAAYRDGVEMAYPVKTKKQKPVKQLYMATVSEKDGRLLFEKRPDTGLLSGFWTFPLEEIQNIEQIVGEQLHIKPIVHVFTHRRWEIWLVKRDLPLTDNRQYLAPDQWQHLSLPTVQHKLLNALEE